MVQSNKFSGQRTLGPASYKSADSWRARRLSVHGAIVSDFLDLHSCQNKALVTIATSDRCAVLSLRLSPTLLFAGLQRFDLSDLAVVEQHLVWVKSTAPKWWAVATVSRSSGYMRIV